MEFTAKQIADFLKGEIEGDPEIKVSSVSKIEEGRDGSLSFLANPKYEKYITTYNIASDVTDKFVRFMVNENTEQSEINKIKEQLLANGAKDIKIETFAVDQDKQLDITKFDLVELVKKYIETNCESLDKTRLFDTGNEIRKTAKENFINVH